MKVRMLTHYSRAADGVTVQRYLGGLKYDLPESEAQLFISIGVAVEDKEMVPETKAIFPCDDNYAGIYAAAPEPQKPQKKRRK